jgi:hypothetical protein
VEIGSALDERPATEVLCTCASRDVIDCFCCRGRMDPLASMAGEISSRRRPCSLAVLLGRLVAELPLIKPRARGFRGLCGSVGNLSAVVGSFFAVLPSLMDDAIDEGGDVSWRM